MIDRRLKMLWSSNAPWSNSGYGQFSFDFLQRIIKDNWNARMIAWAGLTGGSIDYKGIYCYPQMADVWGSDAMVHHGRHFGADVTFSMQDVFVLDQGQLAQIKNWIPYTPIDKTPVPQHILDRLRYAYKIITFSQFGHDALLKEGYSSTLILEGVDTTVFKPLDKMKMRIEMNIPQDKFIVGMIGANKPDGVPRKSWQQALDGFKLFSDKHPNSIFFFETNQPGGFDIPQYASYLGILDKIMTPDVYMAIYHSGPEIINKWLNCFDVLLHPSSTEGFGLIITEAMSAGTPVVIANNTSQPEQIIDGKTGAIAECNFPFWTPGGGMIYFPDPVSIADSLEKVYRMTRENENKVSIDCRNRAKEKYDLDKIYKEKWVPFLEKTQLQILGEPQKDK